MLTRIVTTHPLVSFLFSIVVCLFMAIHIPSVKTIEDVDRFVLMDDPDNLFYEEFKNVFGNDEFFLIVLERPDIFTVETLQLIQKLTLDLERLELVRKVESLANVDINIGGEDFFETRRFLERVPDVEQKLSDLHSQATSHPLYVNNFISSDGTTTAIVVSAFDRPEDDFYRTELVHAVETVLQNYEGSGIQFHLAGKTITDVRMSQYMEQDFALLVPLSYLLIIGIIIFFYRNIRLTIFAVVNISACLISTMGFLGLTGITQNSVVSIIFPLVMALSLCDTVHIFSSLDKKTHEKTGDKRLALKSSLDLVIWPCFLTTVTTSIGFLSLLVSDLKPIQDFAVVAFAAIIFEFFYSFVLMPPLLLLSPAEQLFSKRKSEQRLLSWLERLSAMNAKHYRPIVLVGALTILLSLFFSTRIQIETNIIDFFKQGSDFRNSLTFVESKLGGIEAFDISLKSPETEGFKDPKRLMIVERIQEYAADLPGVDVTLSFADYIKDMNKAFHNNDPDFHALPASRELTAQYLLLYDSDDIEDFINPLYDHARIVIRISEHSSSNQREMINQLEDYIATLDASGLDIRVTGRVLQDVNVIDSLFLSQVQSLGLALLIISLIMFFALRSLRLGLLSLLPNIFPIVVNFGIMGLVGIPLNTATALIAAIAIGIAVDDTIHFFTEYQKHAKNNTMQEALRKVVLNKGKAIVTSSFILSVGFGVLVFSSFVPTIYFGLLCAMIMLTALIGDLIVLPSIMLRFPRLIGKQNTAGAI